MNQPRFSDHHDYTVIDKINDEWVLAYRLSDEIVLRIRIHHGQHDEDDIFICEVSDFLNRDSFREVARFKWDPTLLWYLPDDELNFDKWPDEYFGEFVDVARVWSACVCTALFGSARGLGDSPSAC